MSNKLKSHNLNGYHQNRLDQSFNNVNITFMTTLRAPIQYTDLNKTVHYIPSCFGRQTHSTEKCHTTKDIEKLAIMSIYEHLIRNRIGIKPLLDTVIFETTLRSNQKRSISLNQKFKPQKQINKERIILPYVFKDPFIEIKKRIQIHLSIVLKKKVKVQLNQGKLNGLLHYIIYHTSFTEQINQFINHNCIRFQFSIIACLFSIIACSFSIIAY